MRKKVCQSINAGLETALADIRGEPGHVVKVAGIARVDLKSVGKKTGLSPAARTEKTAWKA